jgi:hypothetical protein
MVCFHAPVLTAQNYPHTALKTMPKTQLPISCQIKGF